MDIPEKLTAELCTATIAAATILATKHPTQPSDQEIELAAQTAVKLLKATARALWP